MADRVADHDRVDVPARAVAPADVVAAARAYAPLIAFLATIGAVAFVNAPVLGHYFFNDDFVPFADISQRGTWEYVRDLFLLNERTPNWRFLTGLIYLGEYRSFGLDPVPYMVLSVLLHTATAGLLFWLLWRVLDAAAPAFFGATLFGATAAHVPTVGQVTALNNVLAAFLLLAAAVSLYEGLERRRIAAGLAISSVCFALAIAANDSSAVSAPLFVMIAMWKLPDRSARWQDRRVWLRVGLVSSPFVAMGVAALTALGTCQCTEADLYSSGDHLLTNIWVYLGRLLYPVGLEAPGNVGAAHRVAGVVVVVLALLALARGPALGRIAAVWLFVSIVPYVPLGVWTASRYVYLASVPFAILAAVYVSELGRVASRVAPAAYATLALLAMAALALVSWQTWEQNEVFAAQTDRWRDLVSAIEDARIDPQPGATVYLRGGPVRDPLVNCAVLPSLGRVLWDDVNIFIFQPDELASYALLEGFEVYVLDYDDGSYASTAQPPSTSEDALALPHVPPDARGNLCLPAASIAE